MVKAVFFDLDGTLLPMDMERFTRAYFGILAARMAPHGYAAEELIRAVWSGTKAMVNNDGSRTNEEAFWEDFARFYGEKGLRDKAVFDSFYRNEFEGARKSCGFDRHAAELVAAIKARGIPVVLATNPIFPLVAQEARARWAGLDPADFLAVTTYENSRYCKPNPAYYTELLSGLGLAAADCLMVGNDAEEDLAAEQAGMQVYLLTDCLINKKGKNIIGVPHGGFGPLLERFRP